MEPTTTTSTTPKTVTGNSIIIINNNVGVGGVSSRAISRSRGAEAQGAADPTTQGRKTYPDVVLVGMISSHASAPHR